MCVQEKIWACSIFHIHSWYAWTTTQTMGKRKHRTGLGPNAGVWSSFQPWPRWATHTTHIGFRMIWAGASSDPVTSQAHYLQLVGGCQYTHPSEKYFHQLGWWHSQYMGKYIKWQPNHQPDSVRITLQLSKLKWKGEFPIVSPCRCGSFGALKVHPFIIPRGFQWIQRSFCYQRQHETVRILSPEIEKKWHMRTQTERIQY